MEGNPCIKVESVPILPGKTPGTGMFSWCIHKFDFIDKGGVPKAKQAGSVSRRRH